MEFVEASPPGENKALSPDQKSFHAAKPSTNRGQNRLSPGSIRPLALWNANLGFFEAAPPGEDKAPSPDHDSHTFTYPTNPGRKPFSPEPILRAGDTRGGQGAFPGS